MSKHLGNLSRLQHKLASIYGDDDALAIQVQNAIAAREASAQLTHRRSFPRSPASTDRSANLRQAGLCNHIK